MRVMELTDKMIEDAINCRGAGSCNLCSVDVGSYSCQTTLAINLKAERAKPKHDVWEYAPEWATYAEVRFGTCSTVNVSPNHTYTRTLTKTRAREIAEEARRNYHGTPKDDLLEEIIEAAILKREAELKEAGE